MADRYDALVQDQLGGKEGRVAAVALLAVIAAAMVAGCGAQTDGGTVAVEPTLAEPETTAAEARWVDFNRLLDSVDEALWRFQLDVDPTDDIAKVRADYVGDASLQRWLTPAVEEMGRCDEQLERVDETPSEATRELRRVAETMCGHLERASELFTRAAERADQDALDDALDELELGYCASRQALVLIFLDGQPPPDTQLPRARCFSRG